MRNVLSNTKRGWRTALISVTNMTFICRRAACTKDYLAEIKLTVGHKTIGHKTKQLRCRQFETKTHGSKTRRVMYSLGMRGS